MESEKVCGYCGHKIMGKTWQEGIRGTVYHIDEQECISLLKSRISSLEAALSLEPENVESVSIEIYEFETGCLWAYADEMEKRNWQTSTVRLLTVLRKLAGLEVSDGE